MSPTGEGLRISKRGLLLAGGVGLVLFGSVRLAVDEVRLAGHAARTIGLEQRAESAARDRRHLVRLEMDLQREQEQLATLSGEIKARDRRLQALLAERQSARAITEDLEERTQNEQRELQALLAKSKRISLQHAEDSKRYQALSLRHERDLEESRALAEERARGLAQAERDLASLERDHASLERDLGQKTRDIAGLQADVLRGSDRADRAEEQLSQLEAAGVNVARLTGQRPMPRIFAVVVRVDTDAVPALILVDAGRDRGLERGDILYVIRQGREIARLEVDEVSEQASSTRVVRGIRGLRLRPGEDVTSVKPEHSQR